MMSRFEFKKKGFLLNFADSQFSIEYNNVSDVCQNVEPAFLLEIITFCQTRLFWETPVY